MAFGTGTTYLFGDSYEEENFGELLDQYIDDTEIEEKKRLEDKEYGEEKSNLESHNDLSHLSSYAITITEFIKDYLEMDISKIETQNLTHKNFKDLTKDNPLVIGIYNKYVDIDEVVKGDYILVTDYFGNIGSYLNPNHLRDLTRLEIIKKQLKIMGKIRISMLSELDELYNRFLLVAEEYEYLSSKCSQCDEMLKKVGKSKSKILRSMSKYYEEFDLLKDKK